MCKEKIKEGVWLACHKRVLTPSDCDIYTVKLLGQMVSHLTRIAVATVATVVRMEFLGEVHDPDGVITDMPLASALVMSRIHSTFSSKEMQVMTNIVGPFS